MFYKPIIVLSSAKADQVIRIEFPAVLTIAQINMFSTDPRTDKNMQDLVDELNKKYDTDDFEAASVDEANRTEVAHSQQQEVKEESE